LPGSITVPALAINYLSDSIVISKGLEEKDFIDFGKDLA
jgi:hypothetical protein